MANLKVGVKYKSESVQIILDAMASQANKVNVINKFTFTYPVQGTLSNKDWSEVFCKCVLEAFIKSSRLLSDQERYIGDVNGISPPEHGVVGDIIEAGD